MGEHDGDSRNPGPAIALVNSTRLLVTKRNKPLSAVSGNTETDPPMKRSKRSLMVVVVVSVLLT